MNCLTCRGACCETIVIPLSDHADTNRWVTLHGVAVGEKVALDCRCSALTGGGECSIYDDRPELCRTYLAGGKECLETVRARRTPVQYAEIRGAEDPERIH